MRFRSFLTFSATFTAVLGHVIKREIETGLASSLSPGAYISYPGSERFINSNKRFTELSRPDYQAVVHVANEEDVVATVCLWFYLRMLFLFVTSLNRFDMPLPTTLLSSPSPEVTV